MKKAIRKVIAAIVVFAMMLCGFVRPVTNAYARQNYSSYSYVPSDTADYIYDLINKQSFSLIVTQTAKDYTDYFFYRSAWKVGNTFPYGNDGGYVYWITDEVYTYNVAGAKGCLAYAKFAQMSYYQGQVQTQNDRKYSDSSTVTEEGIKSLLLTDGQAGEHLRIDNKHSLLYLAGDDNGFYALSYEGGPICLVYFTWHNFAVEYSGYRVCLYNIDKAVNDATPTQDDQSPSITEASAPATLKVGKPWTCTGIITSRSPLKSVSGCIRDVDWNVIYSYTETPYTTSYKMAGSKIDYNLYFNKLSPGVYYYEISASNDSGTAYFCSNPINIGSISKPKITGASVPSTLRVGKPWTCTGKIKSSTSLRRVTGEILDSNGIVVYSYTKKTSAKSYNLRSRKIIPR